MFNWLNSHEHRVIDVCMFVFYVLYGLAVSYGPHSDSMAFITRAFRNIDHELLGWIFFTLPAPVYLLRGAALWKFGGLIPLGFVLGALSWFILITPNRAWLVVPVYALLLVLLLLHYFKRMVT